MKRRTLDLLFAIGGLGLAGLLLIIGLVLSSNSTFADNYVRDQLTAQKITFKTADTLTAEEKAKPCVVANAGQLLTTGKQAECYARDFIGLHLETIGGGKTYAELGADQTAARAAVDAATKAGDPNLAALQKKVTDITAARETVFKGETLKGLLLTSYGFSEMGNKAGQGATATYAGAALLLVLSLFGFVHALMTPKSRGFAVPDRFEATAKDMAHV